MKNKILSVTAILLIAGFAAFNVNLNTENDVGNFLTLANVEALASGESGGVQMTCYKDGESSTYGELFLVCKSCSFKPYKNGSATGKCSNG